MTTDERRAALVERVATEIGFQIGRNVEADVRANQMTGDELNLLATAALSLALEEAAKVATAEIPYKEVSNRVEAAIRALIPEK